MSESHIDHDHLEITGAHEAVKDDAHVDIIQTKSEHDILIAVTQAYGPAGDQLVGISDFAFDGYPALTLLVRAGEREGFVHLSPIHGDARKAGFTDIEVGAVCELLCPVSKQPLNVVEQIEGETDAHYCALYLTPELSQGSMVLISNVWGHYHSRIVDNFELISYWANEHEDLDDSDGDA